MAQNFQQNLVHLCCPILASYKVSELGFNHKISGFYVAPGVVMVHEFLVLEHIIIVHLPPCPGLPLRSSCCIRLEGNICSSANGIYIDDVVTCGISLVCAHFVYRETVVMGPLGKLQEVIIVCAVLTPNLNSSHNISCNTAGDVHLNPLMVSPAVVLFSKIICES